MDRERTEKQLEEWLDSALAEYGRAEPRSGMEARVIRHLRNGAGEKSRRLHWRRALWVSAGAITVVLFLIVLPPQGKKPAPAGQFGGNDQELLLGIDGLLNREIPSALEPALVLTQEITRSNKK